MDINSIPNGYYWLHYDKPSENTEFVEISNGMAHRMGTDELYFGDDFEYMQKQGATVKLEKAELKPPSWAK